MRASLILATCAVCLGVQNVDAGVILNPAGGGGAQINAFERVGMAFTAEDANVKAAMHLFAINSSFDPTQPIRFQLHQGVGVGGPLLFDQAYVVAGSFTGFFDVDLSSINLVVGNSYSFTASIDGTSPFWGLTYSTLGTNGVKVANDPTEILRNSPLFALRVAPIQNAEVPEPGSLILLSLGAIGVFGASRRRR